MGTFENLFAINVNNHTEKKKTGNAELTYLSWPFAWAEVKKRYPDASYDIWKDQNGIPYAFDPRTGYMVYTSVTIDGVTHEMWLPVMDSTNHAMKAEGYSVKTKYKEIWVAPATMFDINKTIMRCLVKNLAMFGLGLYIYAGEDLPESDTVRTEPFNSAPDQKPVEAAQQEGPGPDDPVTKAEWNAMLAMISRKGLSAQDIGARWGFAKRSQLKYGIYTALMKTMDGMPDAVVPNE